MGAFLSSANPELSLQIEGIYRGASAFLLCSGPSLLKSDLSLLSRRGVLTMAVNNTAAVFRPNLWMHVDRSEKFLDAIWRDPAITKFCVAAPKNKLNKPLLEKRDGKFRRFFVNGEMACPSLMPAVVGYARNGRFDPDIWLPEPSVNWGNSRAESARNGWPHVNNVMIAAVKVLYLLGIKTLYLLGCDFTMDPSSPYAFPEQKDQDGGHQDLAKSLSSFDNLNVIFAALQPRFIQAGFRVVNCTPNSGLRAFDYEPLELAVKSATSHIPPEPLDTEGWYSLQKERSE